MKNEATKTQTGLLELKRKQDEDRSELRDLIMKEEQRKNDNAVISPDTDN